MKKWLNLVLPAVALASLVSVGPAQAATQTFSLAPTGGGSTGTYSVTLTFNGVNWSAQVTGDNNGAANKAAVHQISVTVFSDLAGLNPIDLSSAATTGSNTAGGGFTNTGQWNQPITGPGSSNANWQRNNLLQGVAPKGGNAFNGTWSLSSSNYHAVTVSVQDNGQQWSITNAALVPEMSSLALLLPGLIPLGIALRRRRVQG